MAYASLYMKLHGEYQLIKRDDKAPDFVLRLEHIISTIDLNGYIQQCRFDKIKLNHNFLSDSIFFLLDADKQELKYPDNQASLSL